MRDIENRIVLGLGHEGWTNMMRTKLESAGVGSVVAIAHMRKNIVPRAVETDANMVIVSDSLIGDDNTEDEWLELVEELLKVNLYIRFVFVCDRDSNDIFLSKLAYSGVHDIFLGNSFPSGWDQQLLDIPKIENVSVFRSKADTVTDELRSRKTRHSESDPEEIVKQTLIPKADKRKAEKEIVTKTVREVVYQQINIPPKTVAVVSFHEGVGATLCTRMIAELAAEKGIDVGVCESAGSDSVWYPLLNAETHIERHHKGKWESWHSAFFKADAIPSLSDVLHIDGVQYMIRHPQENFPHWSESETAALLTYSKHVPLLFCDISTGYDQSVEQIVLKSADTILLVCNYDPVRLSRYRETYEQFLQRYANKTIVLMAKSTEHSQKAYKSEIEKYFDTKRIFHIPVMPELADAYTDGKSVWGYKNLNEGLSLSLSHELNLVLSAILGKDVLKRAMSSNGGGFFGRIKRALKGSDDPASTS